MRQTTCFLTTADGLDTTARQHLCDQKQADLDQCLAAYWCIQHGHKPTARVIMAADGRMNVTVSGCCEVAEMEALEIIERS